MLLITNNDAIVYRHQREKKLPVSLRYFTLDTKTAKLPSHTLNGASITSQKFALPPSWNHSLSGTA
jgi:hypothetical protein